MCFTVFVLVCLQGRSQQFDLGGYKWVKETKQPHKKLMVDWFGGIYTDIPPVATPLFVCLSACLRTELLKMSWIIYESWRIARLDLTAFQLVISRLVPSSAQMSAIVIIIIIIIIIIIMVVKIPGVKNKS